ncbi:cardiolipin synthase [Duganella sp. CF458]|uniref:phospholipase D-like domain-containing protein n=1 Tax=Duganella sp. CF458 TaxID=1884368 RepID=UPI0008E577EF|nr:phospholipase D-like domain-containing protein [Duganella sp. CF458]SFF82626.1 cardiolipin synthase [Duganella sp. CF458]
MKAWLVVFLAGWTLLACASLPEVDADQAKARAKAVPAVVTAKGKLPRQTTEQLLKKRWAKSTLDLKGQAALEEAATGVPLIAGNKVQLLFDGPQTMAEMMKAIAAAKDHINFETYIFDQDELGMQFADLLIQKQKEGVVVNVIYDSVGTIGVPQEFFDHMKEGGVKLLAFNPVNPAKARGNGWKLNARDHRKMLIVDGKVGFTGGINISDTYSKSSPFRGGSGGSGGIGSGSGGGSSPAREKGENDVGWRDTHVRIEGPAVQAMQWLFVQTWIEQDADDLRDAKYFTQVGPAGDKVMRVLGSRPEGHFEIYKALLLAMQEAKKSIHITCAYFVPDDQTMEALTNAARRGVEVQLVLPSVSDSGLVFHAGRAFYQPLLEAGVKIYELKLSVLHAKTVVIDGVWSTVGSTNLDRRSFLHNSEVNVIVMGDVFGLEMENAFKEDLHNSKEVTLVEWNKRPISNRLKEWLARVWDYWL